MRRPVPSLAPAVLALLLGACAQTGSADEEPVKAPPRPQGIVLGAVYGLTGPQAVLDVPSSRGARIAIDAANAAGGVLGQPVELIVRDGESRPDVSAAKTAELLADHPSTTVVFGLSDSDLVRAAAPAAIAAGRAFLTSGATSPKLPAQVPGPLYLACFGDNVQAAAAAQWLDGTHPGARVAVLYDETHAYTRLLQRYFAEAWSGRGGTITSTTSFTSSEDPVPPEAHVGADVVFLSAETALDAARLARRLRGAGFTGPIVGGDGYDAPAVWAAHGELSDIWFTTHAWLAPDHADERVVAFREAWLAAYPTRQPDGFAALGHDATRVLLAAIEEAGSPDPAAVAEALGGIRWFEGVTGAMTYPPGSHVPVKTVFVVGVDAGALSLAQKVLPSEVPAP